MRLAFDFSEEAAAELQKLKELSGTEDNADLFRNALRLYKWFLDQKEAGSEVIIRNPEEEKEFVVDLSFEPEDEDGD